MPGSTPLQLYAYPVTTDAASPAGIQTLAQSVEKQVVAIFPDTATRDSRWTTATGLANGAVCFITATGELQLRSAGAWVVIGGRAQPFSMATGSASVTTAASALSGPTAVTFPTSRFSQTPRVTATISSTSGSLANGSNARTDLLTTTGFNMYIVSPANSAAGTSIACHWHAMQATSSASDG